MQIAYTTKYRQLFYVLALFLCIVRNAAQECVLSNNQTNTQFQSNLKALLKDLVQSSSSSNSTATFSGLNPDTVYGFLQCYGGGTTDDCVSCSKQITERILEKCRNASGGIDTIDKCSIRFENYSFIGEQNTGGTLIYYNSGKVTDMPDVFREAVRELFTNLLDEALQSQTLYSYGSTNTSTFYRIYSLVQCRMKSSYVGDCKKCLSVSIGDLLSVTFGSNETFQGGVNDMRDCIARFETYPFVNSTSPSPIPPRSPTTGGKSPTEIDSAGGKSPTEIDSAGGKSRTKIGIILGIAGSVSVMLLLCLFAVRRKFKSAESSKGNLDREVDSVIGHNQQIIFNLENIKAATKNFHEDNKLGEGGFGSVYKGTMPNGLQIAVKKLSIQSLQGKEQFLNEVKLVAKIQHRNLVKILGCCAEGSERLLVYELLANKSLDKILFHPQKSKNLDWPKRLKIIYGVARGLLYLHEDSHLRIIHRDIKASNILLDEKMEPKIADFGLARLIHQDESHVETRLAGTYGYMAPEYAMLGHLSCKADVYSFGVVILEIICGRKNTDNRLSPEFQSLIEWVWRSYKQGNITDVVDKAIIESFSSEQVLRCIHVGLLCTQVDALVRPGMTSVHAMLLNSSETNLPNPVNPAYINGAQEDISSPISASTSITTSTISTISREARSNNPSTNNVTITDLNPR